MAKALKRQSSDVIPTSLKKKEKQLTKMLFIIFVCFMLTYLPAFVVKKVSLTKIPEIQKFEIIPEPT